jgi:hypothetical protein
MFQRVNRSHVVIGLALVAALALAAAARPVWADSPKEAAAAGSPGSAALRTAAENHKYLFIYFWRDDTQQVRAMRDVFQGALAKMTKRADSVEIQVGDPAEKEIVARYGVGRSPMPLVLAIAPNGAVTKGLLMKFDENQLRQAFVSSCTAACMKALQDRKLVLLCVEPAGPRVKQVSLQQGVQDFTAGEEYQKSTAVVVLDAGDMAEAAFLKDLKVDPKTTDKVTVLLAPPAKVVGTFAGEVTKDQLVAKLKAAQSSCCPGGKCGPGGCCPAH